MTLYVIPTGLLETNTYIIEENGGAIIVDPGDEAYRITDFLHAHGLKPEYVLVTHAHFDHIGAVAAMQNAGAKVYMSEIDYTLLRSCGFDLGIGFGKRVTPFTADVTLADGQEFELLGIKFKAMETPGHTPGGMCFLTGNIIFTGDTLFRLGVGRTDFAYCDGDKLNASVKRLFALDGDYEVYPGHGEPTTLDIERRYNPYAKA